MKSAFIACAMLATLSARQEPAQETAAELDKRVRESLQQKVVVVKNLTLPMFLYVLATSGDVDIDCYADPVAIPKIEEIKTSVEGEAPLDEILEKTLKAKGLVHFVWQGLLVFTDEKGRKALEEPAWAGLTQEALGDRPELVKKLGMSIKAEWDTFKPREALKALAKASGVAINADRLATMEVKNVEKRGMLSPVRTTLRGALVCLARTTGITFEVAKDGTIIAKAPAKK